MKRTLVVLVMVLALLTALIPGVAAAEPEVPAGYTAIRTQADLELVRQNLSGKFLLMNDLTLTGTFTPLAPDKGTPFTGVFDGAGHTISGLTLSVTGTSTKSAGLFCCNAGIIRNLVLSGVDVQMTLSVSEEGHMGIIGAVAGSNAGSITNCSVNGTVQVSTTWTAADVMESRLIVSNRVGALVGENTGTITGCTANASVYGSTPMVLTTNGISYLGGIAGLNSGDILYCTNLHNLAMVGGGAVVGGGMAGASTGNVTDCLSYMSNRSTGAAGIVGENNGQLTRCVNAGYALSGCGITETNGGGMLRCYYSNIIDSGTLFGDDFSTARSAAQMTRQGSFSGFDFDAVWKLETGDSYPTLRPYVLQVTELALVSLPDKLDYIVGEAFDPSGLVVNATYHNGDVETVEHYDVQGFDTATAGSKTVTLIFGGKEVAFTITVSAAPVKGEAPPTGTPSPAAALCLLAGVSAAALSFAWRKRK